MKFNYVAVRADSKPTKGVIDAPNLRTATQLLIDDGFFVRKISPVGGALKVDMKSISFGRVKLIDKALFIKHLGTMIKSGINMNEALEVIAEQTNSGKFKKIIENVVEQIKAGQPLAKALERYPKVFDPLFVNIIKVGEESGTLEGNLDYLASELEDRLELRRNMKSAAFYPVIVLLATFGLGLVLTYFVLPKITRLFDTLSFELPLTTRILLGTATLIENHGGLILLGIIGFIVGFRLLISQKLVKPLWHMLLIKSPIIGGILINYNLVMITRTLSILLKSGITIDYAIGITIETTSNEVYKKKLKYLLPQVQKGKRISDSLSEIKQSKRKPLFSLLVIKMINVGETSGKLDESMEYLASYFEKEVDNTTKNLTTILEPILLLTVGLIVGFIAISVISPIYQVTGRFAR